MTPDELRRIREGMGWTQTQAAARLSVSANTWARWERGEVQPHPLREPVLQRFLRTAQRRGTQTGRRIKMTGDSR
jgi:transcriptional regulator with XRE-family HTH domain